MHTYCIYVLYKFYVYILYTCIFMYIPNYVYNTYIHILVSLCNSLLSLAFSNILYVIYVSASFLFPCPTLLMPFQSYSLSFFRTSFIMFISYYLL